MADEEHAERPPESREHSENAHGPPGPLTLNTMLKRTFAAIVTLVGVAAGLAVFTAPFAKTGPALISITLAALASIMLVGVGFAVFYTYRKKKITASVSAIAAGALLVLLVGAGTGYLIWHARSSPTTVIGVASPTPSQPSRFSINVACHDNTATVLGRFPEQYVGTEIDFVFNGILPATNRITSLAAKLSFQKQFQIARFLKNSHRLLVLVTDPQSHELARQQVDCR
jgi:hypothetical protein